MAGVFVTEGRRESGGRLAGKRFERAERRRRAARRRRWMASRDEIFAAKDVTVLVVDDDDDVRAVTVMALEDRGFVVHEAAGGREALVMLDRNPEIDVVVTDMVMPGISGFHVARGVRRRRPDVKVLLVSAYAAGLVDAQLPPGGFLAKPFRLSDLEKAVVGLLRN
jgi:CheY-like chemotaxis protein